MDDQTRITVLIVLAIAGLDIAVAGPASSLLSVHASIAGVLRDKGIDFEDTPDCIRILDGSIRFVQPDKVTSEKSVQ